MIVFQAKYLRWLSSFVSREETRYYLNGVSVEPSLDGQKATLVATDGRSLGLIDNVDGLVDRKVIIRLPQWILPFCKPKPPKKSRFSLSRLQPPEPWGVVDGKSLLIVRAATSAEAIERSKDIGSEHVDAVLPHALIDGTFPNWREVMPKQLKGGSAAFDVNLMAKLVTLSRDIGKSTMRVYVNGDKGPATVHCDGAPEFLGVIMPMYYDKPEIPAWLAEAA